MKNEMKSKRERMEKEKKLLAFGGLYCGDCAGYSGEIAELAKKLRQTLKK